MRTCRHTLMPWAKEALAEWVEAETEGTGAVKIIRAARWVTSGESFGLGWVIPVSCVLCRLGGMTHVKVLCEPWQGGQITQDMPWPRPLP